MAERDGQRGGTLVIFRIAILLNLVLAVMILDQLDRTRVDLRTISEELATKQDVAMLRPLGGRKILDTRCSSCQKLIRAFRTLAPEAWN